MNEIFILAKTANDPIGMSNQNNKTSSFKVWLRRFNRSDNIFIRLVKLRIEFSHYIWKQELEMLSYLSRLGRFRELINLKNRLLLGQAQM